MAAYAEYSLRADTSTALVLGSSVTLVELGFGVDGLGVVFVDSLAGAD
jgi:hypothetical protein